MAIRCGWGQCVDKLRSYLRQKEASRERGGVYIVVDKRGRGVCVHLRAQLKQCDRGRVDTAQCAHG